MDVRTPVKIPWRAAWLLRLPLCQFYSFIVILLTTVGSADGSDSNPFVVEEPSIDRRCLECAVNRPRSWCGNGVREPGEDCEFDQFGGKSCATLGFDSGLLLCDSSCHFDTSGCVEPASCGDGIIQPGGEDGEECDGDNLGGTTCEDLGYDSGTLDCDGGCRHYVIGCSHNMVCGDGNIDPGEECDGDDFDGKSCLSLDFEFGELSCNANCTFNTANCSLAPFCGDGICEEFAGETCENCPFDCGVCCEPIPLCSANDCGPRPDGCGGMNDCGPCCGNDRLDEDEECDTTQLDGLSCTDFGFSGGTLGCADNCEVDLSSCHICGNEIAEGLNFESCDGLDLAGETCSSLGAGNGDLACSESCEFDFEGCDGDVPVVSFLLFDPPNWPRYRTKSNTYVYENDPSDVTDEMIAGQNQGDEARSGINPNTVNDTNFKFKMKQPGAKDFTEHFTIVQPEEQYSLTIVSVDDDLSVKITPLVNGLPVQKVAGTYTFKFWNNPGNDEPLLDAYNSGVRDMAMNLLDFIPNTQRPEPYVQMSVTYEEVDGQLVVMGTPTVEKIEEEDF